MQLRRATDVRLEAASLLNQAAWFAEDPALEAELTEMAIALGGQAIDLSGKPNQRLAVKPILVSHFRQVILLVLMTDRIEPEQRIARRLADVIHELGGQVPSPREVIEELMRNGPATDNPLPELPGRQISSTELAAQILREMF